jgi:hypothetical protein
MMWILIFFALGFQGSALPTDADRLAAGRINMEFQKFQERVAVIDGKLSELRSRALNHRIKDGERLAEEVAPAIQEAAKQWIELESTHDRAIGAGHELHRQNLLNQMGLDREFMVYMTFKKNGRRGGGVPIELLLKSWRGLSAGTKTDVLPRSVRRTGKIANVRVNTTDSLLIMMVNGGLIRGRIEGFDGDKVILREILPLPLGRYQREHGYYRVLDLNESARVEVIRKPASVRLQEVPQSTINTEGDYNRGFVWKDHVTRVDFQPDDVELFQMAREERLNEADHKPIVENVNLDQEVHPKYSGLFFMDCEALLQP